MFKFKILLNVVICTSMLISQVVAGPSEDGLAAYKKGDFVKAKRLLQQGAKERDADAQFWLGTMYLYGKGTKKSLKEALRLFRLAAANDNARAQFMLGGNYKSGDGVPKNLKEAARLYRLAAEQGLAAAQLALGALYYFGEGVPQNKIRGFVWLSLAAANGMPEAATHRNNLSKLYPMTPREVARAKSLVQNWRPRQSFARKTTTGEAENRKPGAGMKEIVAWEKCLNDFAESTALKNPDSAATIVKAAMMVCIKEENRHYESQQGIDPKWEAFFKSNVFPDLKQNLMNRVIARILLLRSSRPVPPQSQSAPKQDGTL